MKEHKTKTYIRRAIKIVLTILGGILGVIILAVVALQFPGVQYYIAQKAVSSISEKTHSRIEVGSVKIAFTHSVVLQNIFIESRQRDTLLSIQTLAADVNLLGLFSHDITLNNVRIDSLTAHITRTLPDSSFNFDFILKALRPDSNADSSPDTSSGPGWNIRLGGLSLNGIRGTYDDEVGGLNLRLQLGTLEASIDKFDLPSRHIALKTFLLENSHIVVLQPKENQNKTDENKTDKNKTDKPGSAVLPWIISLDHLMLSDNSAQYDVQGAAHTDGLDPNHLLLDGLTIRAENIYFSEHRITADINHTSFREHSGFEVRELSGGFILDSLHAQLTDVTVETAASRIRQSILLSYSSFSALKNLPGDVNVKATIDNSHIAVSDLLFFQPSLPIRNKPGATIRFSCRLSGPVRDLRVEECRLAAGDSTTVDFTGSIRGLPEAETAYYDVHLLLFSSGRNDIRALIADTLLPKNLVLPVAISMSGNFKGTTKNFSASSVIATSIGRLEGNVALNSGKGPGSKASRWKTDVTVEEFNVGSLLNDPETFGPVSLKASAAGTGLSKDDIEAQLNIEVDKAVVNGYPYRRLSLQGTGSPKMFEGKAEIKDSNIAFTFNGTVNTSEENPTYKFTFDLKGADLQRLRLTSDDMRVAGVITSDLTGQNINDINGNIDVRNVVIIKNRKRYLIDSLLYSSVNREKETHISVESPFLAATFDGTIAPGDLPAALKEHFSRYFTLHDTPPARASRAQAFTFQMSLRDPRILTEVFFPQLDGLTAGVIEGNYDSEKMNLNVNIDIASAAYGGFEIDSLRLKVTSDTQRLQSALRVGSIANSMLHLTNLQLSASIEHDSIEAALQSMDDRGDTKMLLAGVCKSVPDGYQFRFRPDGIIFQNTKWNVPADHYIILGSNQFIAHDVVLRGAGQSLSINSADRNTQQPSLHIECSDFDLATLSRVVERDSGLVRGVLNGNVVLRNLDKHMAFTSDIKVKDLTFVRRPVGDIVLRANNQDANVYDISMDITGNENDIAVRGKYRSKEGGSELDLKFDFNKMNLASIEPFTFGSVQRLSGNMSGELTMTGTIKKPSVAGNLKFTNTTCNPKILGSCLRVNDGQIMFDGKGVHFGSFELLDTLGNKASLSGNLFTEDFRDFRYDCRLHTEHFLLMNRPASRDAMYYGTLFLDSDIFVEGDPAKPVIRMQARLDKGTDLAVVLPESEAGVQQRLGIVRFVDVKHPPNPIISRRKPETDRTQDTTRTRLSAIDLTSNVEVDKEARLRILIDPIAGDSLVIRGEATFSVGMDPSGKLAVTGRYEILEGSYQLSFGELIRRQFAIEKGSSLTWFGSVTDANVNITAIYTAKTSALDLVQDQLIGLSQEERNKYKQELRIQVYLTMDGKLLEPNIHFRLDLPPDQRGALGGSIYAKLNELNGQESELNKQVFALLVLGRFISSNPLASASDGGGLSGFARSSVSQILTEQLNRLSEKVITGVSLNVGVESYQDYSSGTAEGRTQLQLALTKQLFDERVTVQVGGNVDLEGHRSQQNSLNNFAGDIKVAYKMTEDGRWQLQVFRNNTNGGAIEGDLVETGVGIVFTIDYDKLFGFTLKPVRDNVEEK